MLTPYLDAASSFAGDIDSLFALIVIIVGFWFVLVQAIFFYFIFKFRQKDGQKAKYITGEKHEEAKWIHWPHYAVIACDIVIVAYTLIIWNQVKQDLPQQDDMVRIIGQQWSWEFVHSGPDGKLDTADDIRTVNKLMVQEGRTYHYELQSKDVLHNFSVPVFRLKQDAVPGRTIKGWFKPIKTGEYDVQCAEMCGIGHGIMGARIVIHDDAGYQNWMAEASSQNQDSTMVAQTGNPSYLGDVQWVQPQ